MRGITFAASIFMFTFLIAINPSHELYTLDETYKKASSTETAITIEDAAIHSNNPTSLKQWKTHNDLPLPFLPPITSQPAVSSILITSIPGFHGDNTGFFTVFYSKSDYT